MGLLALRDDVRHRERLPRARDAEQHLVLLVLGEPLFQLRDGRRLITFRLEDLGELERRTHEADNYRSPATFPQVG